jgi:polyferredoxin
LVGVVLIASLFVYRPYYYLICPVGLLTWLLEYLSIFRVRVDRNKCNDCGICISKSPCPSIKPILDSDIVRPGHILRTQMRVKDTNKTVPIT